MIVLADLVPSWLQLGGFLGVVFASLVLLLCGRILLGGRSTPELQMFAGWGAFSLVLTAWGLATTSSMRLPALLFVALAAAGLVVPRWRPRRADWIALARVLVLSLPIWAIMIAVQPVLPDTYTNFLPNAVYLYDHGFFPADARAPAFAVWPAFPYNVQFVTFLASLALPQFPPNSLVLFDILLQLMAALLIARLLRPRTTDFAAAPSWTATAGGLLLATALNPGFIPRVHFSSYAEPSLAVGILFIGWVASCALTRLAEGRRAAWEFWLLALILLAFVNIKQIAIVLAGGLLLGAFLQILADRRLDRLRAILGLALAVLPMLALYGAWRVYVLTHFVSGELKVLPEAAWQFDILPTTIENILGYIAGRPYYFVFIALAIWLSVRLTRREGLTPATRLLLMTTVLFVVYNLALLLIYVVHMGPVAGADAHSYFRYMTHLSLLVVLGLTVAARERWLTRDPAARMPGWQRFVPAATILCLVLAPVVFVKWLRYDVEPPHPLVWNLAREVAGEVKDGDKLALLLPGDNGSVSLMLRAALKLTPPRRDLDFYDVSAVPGGLEAALAHGYRKALVSCNPATGKAELLDYDDAAWRVVQSWPYQPTGNTHWAGVLSPGPFCHG